MSDRLGELERQRVSGLACDPIAIISRMPQFPDHLSLVPGTATVEFWGGKMPRLHSFVLFALVAATAEWGNGQTGDFAMPYPLLFTETSGDVAARADEFTALVAQVVVVYSAESRKPVKTRYSSVLAAPDLIQRMHKFKCVTYKDPSIERGKVALIYNVSGDGNV